MNAELPQPHQSEHALQLDDLQIGEKITVHFVTKNAKTDYVVADLPRRSTVGDLGPTADVVLRDDSGEELTFAAADLGLLPHLGGYWSTTYTTHWARALNTPVLGPVPRP